MFNLNSTIIIGIAVVYILFTTGISIWSSKFAGTTSKFMTGDRNIGVFVISFLLLSEWIATGSTVGTAEIAFTKGISVAWNVLSLTIALVLFSIFMAKKYQKTVANFHNLEHRLEFVTRKNGVEYFDNSFSTTPESTILDLKSFSSQIILIAGGADKGADFKLLAKAIKNKVKFLVLLKGQATPRITKELLAIKFPKTKMVEVDKMEKAVSLARAQAETEDVVLLSTACASFGIFKNYKERGDLFKRFATK